MSNINMDKLIRKELREVLNEISDYDRSLIPTEDEWDDASVKEYLYDMKSISKIINTIDYNRTHERYYNELVHSTKLEIISFILKYNLNSENKSQEELEKLDINDLEDYIYKLSPEADKEYNIILYEFVSDLVDEEILDKSSFYSIR